MRYVPHRCGKGMEGDGTIPEMTMVVPDRSTKVPWFERAIDEDGRSRLLFHLALSAGATPERLAVGCHRDNLRWCRTTVASRGACW